MPGEIESGTVNGCAYTCKLGQDTVSRVIEMRVKDAKFTAAGMEVGAAKLNIEGSEWKLNMKFNRLDLFTIYRVGEGVEKLLSIFRIKPFISFVDSAYNKAIPKCVNWHGRQAKCMDTNLKRVFAAAERSLIAARDKYFDRCGRGQHLNRVKNELLCSLLSAWAVSFYLFIGLIVNLVMFLCVFVLHGVQDLTCLISQFVLCLFFPAVAVFFVILYVCAVVLYISGAIVMLVSIPIWCWMVTECDCASLSLRLLSNESLKIRCTATVVHNTVSLFSKSSSLTKRLQKDEVLSMDHFACALDLRSVKSGFVSSGWMTIKVKIELLDQQKAARPSSSSQNVDPPMCVFCLVNPQTSGFAHARTCHKCVCRRCAERYDGRQNARCPVCMEKIDHVIYDFFLSDCLWRSFLSTMRHDLTVLVVKLLCIKRSSLFGVEEQPSVVCSALL